MILTKMCVYRKKATSTQNNFEDGDPKNKGEDVIENGDDEVSQDEDDDAPNTT